MSAITRIRVKRTLNPGRLSVLVMIALAALFLLGATTAMAADPVAADDTPSVNEDAGSQELNVLANDTDVDNDIDSTSVTVIQSPSHGTVDSLDVNGSLWYTPEADFIGEDTLQYEITDLTAGTDGAEVVITVANANDDPPVADNDSATAAVTVAEDGGSQPLDVLANDTDPDYDIDSTSVTVISGAFYGTIDSLGADGRLWYTPDDDFNGLDALEYELTDLTADSDTARVTVLVTSDGTVLAAEFDWDGDALFTGTAIQFNDSTSESPSTWSWDFGDGSSVGTSQNPTHTYSEGGTYTVELIASNDAGEEDTVSHVLLVGAMSTAGTFETAGMRITLLAVVSDDTACSEPAEVDQDFADKVVMIVCVANDDAGDETITNVRVRSRMKRPWSVGRVALYRESTWWEPVISQHAFDGTDFLVNEVNGPGPFSWDGSGAGDAVDFSVSPTFGSIPAGDSVYYYIVIDANTDSILADPAHFHTQGLGVALNAPGVAAEAITTVNHGAGPVDDPSTDVAVVMNNGPDGTLGATTVLGAGCLQQPYIFNTSALTEVVITAPSMTVIAGTSDLDIPLRVENAGALSYLKVPVKIEPLTGDAYITAITMRFDDRLTDTTILEGTRNLFYFNERATASPCPYSPDSAVDGSVANTVTTLEAAVQFGGCVASPPCTGSTSELTSGLDSNGSLVMTVNIGSDTGRFEIDETCMEIVGGAEARDLFGNSVPVTFEPGVIVVASPPSVFYVDSTSGSDSNPGTMALPFATIQTAMDSVPPGTLKTTIHVGAGTYVGPILFNDGAPIELVSEDGAFATHIVGDSTNPVVTMQGTFTDQEQSIRGFTIRDNLCTSCVGGVVVESPIVGTITECMIRDNYGDDATGGIYFGGPSGTIANNWIIHNTHAGSSGAEEAGGIFIAGNSIVAVTNNTIAFNESGSNGSGVYIAPGTIAASAQGVSQTRLDNNIVFRNRPMYGLYAGAGHFADSVRTSIVSENGTAPETPLNINANLDYDTATVILTGDPLFADTTTGDYHLTCGSPALALGRVDYVPASAMYDIDGQDRLGVDQSTVDAGADEFYDTNKIADFALVDSSDTMGCTPLLVEFTNLSECLDETWIWDFGDGTVDTGFGADLKNATHEYTTGGLFTVTLTARNPLYSDVATKEDLIYVEDQAHPTITHSTPGCTPATVDLAADLVAEADSLFWFFGDGDTASVEGPVACHDTTHVYQDTGIFIITVRTYNHCGMAEGVDTLHISTALNLAISSTFDTLPNPDTSLCTPFEVTFTATSEESLFSYMWLFGDGDIDSVSGQMPTHIYDSGGEFVVSLIVESACGIDTATLADTIRVATDAIVSSGPLATPMSACPDQAVTFFVVFSLQPDSIRWLFGDGSQGAGTMTEHSYDSQGHYVPVLVIWDACDTDTLALIGPDTLVVGMSPTAAFSSSADSLTGLECAPLEVRFYNEAIGTITGYKWVFGDGTTSTEQNPVHVYESANTYDVTLIAIGPCAEDSLKRTGYIDLAGAAEYLLGPSASGHDICADVDTVDFEVLVNPAVADSALWVFGDGDSASGFNASHVYHTPGVYTPEFVYRHACGVDLLALEGDNDSIVVGGLPVPAFTVSHDSGYAPLAVNFTDLTPDNPGNWLWDFGDGDTASIASPAHSYATCGEYSVSLDVTDGCGTGSATQIISVGDFDLSSQIIGTTGDSRVYRVDVSECVFYDNTITLSAQLTSTPTRGTIVFDFDNPQGTPPFNTDMTAIPVGGLSTGQYTIRITATDQQRGVSRTTTHQLDFEGVSLLAFAPAAMSFGDVDTSICVMDTLCIRNSAQPRGSDSVLTIVSVTCDNPVFQVIGATSVSLPPGDSAKWQIQYCPTIVSADLGTITIESDDPAFPDTSLAVTGAGIREQTPPQVKTVVPDSAQETTIDETFRVVMSEAIRAPDPLNDAISVRSLTSGTTIAGSVILDDADTMLTFTPADFLPVDDTLLVSVDADLVADLAGNTLDGDRDGTGEGAPTDNVAYTIYTGPGVYPGDADNDGNVDESDVLPLGRFYGETGTARTNPQPGFTLQPATRWDTPMATYADANGDGVIDSMDVCPIADYFDMTADMPKTVVEAWMDEAAGWDDHIMRALIAALDHCPGESQGQSVLKEFLAQNLETPEIVPDDYRLAQNYPNPFNAGTIIEYGLSEPTHVALRVYDIQGKLVRVLADRVQEAGRYHVIWNGRDENGNSVASGVYFYRLDTPGFSQARKMVLLK